MANKGNMAVSASLFKGKPLETGGYIAPILDGGRYLKEKKKIGEKKQEKILVNRKHKEGRNNSNI